MTAVRMIVATVSDNLALGLWSRSSRGGPKSRACVRREGAETKRNPRPQRIIKALGGWWKRRKRKRKNRWWGRGKVDDAGVKERASMMLLFFDRGDGLWLTQARGGK